MFNAPMSAPERDRAVRNHYIQIRKLKPDSDFVMKLRKELIMSKKTHNFTLSRDQVIELLGGPENLL